MNVTQPLLCCGPTPVPRPQCEAHARVRTPLLCQRYGLQTAQQKLQVQLHRMHSQRHVCHGIPRIPEGDTRPWDYNLPTLEDMLQDDWPDKVKDWTLFWVMFEQWMYFLRASTRKKPKRFSQDYVAWLKLDRHEMEETLFLIRRAYEQVRARMPELLANLVPMPLIIHSDKPNSLDSDPLFVTDPVVRFQPEPVVKEVKRAPWEDWDEWDLRAWMEKRRQQERWEEDFARRQSEVGKYPSLNVTDGNDARFGGKAVEPYRQFSVEEVMDIMTQGGKTVNPDTIPLFPEDPLRPTDWYQEGVHWVPETEDFIRSIGRWTEDENDLLDKEEDVEDHMLDGEFAQGDEETPAGFGTDLDIEPMEAGFDDDEDD